VRGRTDSAAETVQRKLRHSARSTARNGDVRAVVASDCYPCGLKYSTIPAPSAVTRNPTYSNGFGATFGGCEYIV